MANILSGKIHIIDTAAPGIIFPDDIRIKSIRWVGTAVTNAGEKAEVKDKNDIVIWESIASGANHIDSDLIENKFYPGYKVTVLGSGKLYIEIS